MTRARVLGALAGAAVAACWVSAGTAPLTEAIAGSRDPADFIRDYVTARVRLEDGRGAPPDGLEANERGASFGAPRILLLGGPYHLHPPPGLLAVLAVAWLPWHTAARVWMIMSCAALAWLAWSLARLRDRDRRPSFGRFALLLAALALWPPTLHCFEKGQWSIWLAAFLASAELELERGRSGPAGALFGVAASLKAMPIVVFGLLLARNRRAAAAMAVVVVGLALLATAIDGVAPWRAFVADAPRDVAAWATWLANTASLQGVYARLFTVGPFSRPLVVAPAVSSVAFALTSVAVLAAAVIVGWRRFRARPRPEPDERSLGCWSAAWLALPVLLNPLGWSHVILMLLVPLVMAFRDGGLRTRAVAAIALAALTIPRQRLMTWAGPMPVQPAAALFLGVHAFAALGIYVALLGDGRDADEAGARLGA